MIKLENLQKVYENKNAKTQAINNINLHVKRGEFLALLGPSGCGKTTTLMIIAGLLKPTSGDVYINGRSVTELEPWERNIGMVFQSYALYPNLNVIDNISFPLKQKKIKKCERYERAKEIAAALKIDELLQRKPHQLSGGQQQRVAMARALVKDPDILLLDEPLSNLDAKLKIDVRDEIREMQKRLGITTVIVTHDQEEALAIADKVALLDKGSIQDYGTPAQIYNNPKNIFVADFLGTPPMNFIRVDTGKEDNGSHNSIIQYITKRTRYGDCIKSGKPFTLGIRPHNISIENELSEDSFPAQILLIEDLGRDRLVKVKLNKEDISPLRLITEEDNLAPGQHINIKFNEKRIYLFDSEAGGRI